MEMPSAISYLVKEMNNNSIPVSLRDNYCIRLEAIEKAIRKEIDLFNRTKSKK